MRAVTRLPFDDGKVRVGIKRCGRYATGSAEIDGLNVRRANAPSTQYCVVPAIHKPESDDTLECVCCVSAFATYRQLAASVK